MLMFSLLAAALLIIACVLLFVPLRQNKLVGISLSFLFCVGAVSAYWHWGSGQQWVAFEKSKTRKQQVAKVMQDFKNPQQVIDKLKSHLVQDPNSAKGWFLLGRLYMSQNQLEQAIDAFNKSLDLQPGSLQTQLNLSQALIYANQNEQALEIVNVVLSQSPKQGDALSLKAMAAYNLKDYTTAIENWRKLLPLLPANSKESRLIEQAIAKASSQT